MYLCMYAHTYVLPLKNYDYIYNIYLIGKLLKLSDGHFFV